MESLLVFEGPIETATDALVVELQKAHDAPTSVVDWVAFEAAASALSPPPNSSGEKRYVAEELQKENVAEDFPRAAATMTNRDALASRVEDASLGTQASRRPLGGPLRRRRRGATRAMQLLPPKDRKGGKLLADCCTHLVTVPVSRV